MTSDDKSYTDPLVIVKGWLVVVAVFATISIIFNDGPNALNTDGKQPAKQEQVAPEKKDVQPDSAKAKKDTLKAKENKNKQTSFNQPDKQMKQMLKTINAPQYVKNLNMARRVPLARAQL